MHTGSYDRFGRCLGSKESIVGDDWENPVTSVQYDADVSKLPVQSQSTMQDSMITL